MFHVFFTTPTLGLIYRAAMCWGGKFWRKEDWKKYSYHYFSHYKNSYMSKRRWYTRTQNTSLDNLVGGGGFECLSRSFMSRFQRENHHPFRILEAEEKSRPTASSGNFRNRWSYRRENAREETEASPSPAQIYQSWAWDVKEFRAAVDIPLRKVSSMLLEYCKIRKHLWNFKDFDILHVFCELPWIRP